MKRFLGLGVAVVLCATAGGAYAAPPKPKPKPMTFYFHGTNQVGEADGNAVIGSAIPVMDTKAPTAAESKSKQILNYVAGPNTQCAGNSLFPVWVGTLAGEVTGTAKVTFTAVGAPNSVVEIRLFQDVEEQACNDAFPKVVGSVRVPLPTGQGTVEATIKNVKIKAKRSFMVQFSPTALGADQGRVFYDSTVDKSSISFHCLPAAGKKSC